MAAIASFFTTSILASLSRPEDRLAIAVPRSTQARSDYPIVGAIRWDFWFKGSPTVKRALSNPQWRYRLPFFARVQKSGGVEVNGDSQEVVDREILAASEAGIDYWAFTYYHNIDYQGLPVPPDILKGNLVRQRYFTSQYKQRINHALVLQLGYLGTPTQWDQTIDNVLLVHFRMSNYQKVLGDRPLLYMFNMKDLPKIWGSSQKAQAMLARIREKSKKAGLGNPYVVLMHFYPEEAIQMLKSTGYDAISTYTNPTGNSTGKYSMEHPFSYCVSLNRWFREQFRDRSVQIIPTINTGWDTRPLMNGRDPYVERSPNNDFCQTATPQEIGNHLLETLGWVKANRNLSETNNVLIYAWNEYAEGGWLSPMLQGNERLQATRRAIEKNRCKIKKSSNCVRKISK
jgi:hypothetical protein